MNPTIGSVVLCHSDTMFGKMIAPFSRSKGEGKTWCTHVGLMVTECTLIESRRRTVYTNLHSYPTEHDVVVVSPTFLNTSELVRVRTHAEIYKGKKYGWLKILAHGVDHILGDRFLFRRLCALPNYPICSYLVARAYHKAIGYTFGVPFRAAQPDDIADHVRDNPELWKITYFNSKRAKEGFLNGKK